MGCAMEDAQSGGRLAGETLDLFHGLGLCGTGTCAQYTRSQPVRPAEAGRRAARKASGVLRQEFVAGSEQRTSRCILLLTNTSSPALSFGV